ncbi:hypothetical protein DFH07DRAFT_765913 [Mycena maculata]|uniref:Uncharacterized protein n=1 Tax=Mycena maculata TaxID=230809 RepID=A0AAD7NX93_9AGAR|nr:hypothetical protein DFH07DRAFT_765913 [Mycena maculata]
MSSMQFAQKNWETNSFLVECSWLVPRRHNALLGCKIPDIDRRIRRAHSLSQNSFLTGSQMIATFDLMDEQRTKFVTRSSSRAYFADFDPGGHLGAGEAMQPSQYVNTGAPLIYNRGVCASTTPATVGYKYGTFGYQYCCRRSRCQAPVVNWASSFAESASTKSNEIINQLGSWASAIALTNVNYDLVGDPGPAVQYRLIPLLILFQWPPPEPSDRVAVESQREPDPNRAYTRVPGITLTISFK